MDRIDPGRKSLIVVVKKRSDSGTSFCTTTDAAIHFSEHYCDKRYNWRDDPSQWTRVIHNESPSEHWVTVFGHTVMMIIGIYSLNFTEYLPINFSGNKSIISGRLAVEPVVWPFGRTDSQDDILGFLQKFFFFITFDAEG